MKKGLTNFLEALRASAPSLLPDFEKHNSEEKLKVRLHQPRLGIRKLYNCYKCSLLVARPIPSLSIILMFWLKSLLSSPDLFCHIYPNQKNSLFVAITSFTTVIIRKEIDNNKDQCEKAIFWSLTFYFFTKKANILMMIFQGTTLHQFKIWRISI